MEITWNMRFKMFLAALVIYAASLYERVYIGAKNAELLTRENFSEIATRLKEYREKILWQTIFT